jgi:hypothetical protein
MGGWLKNVVFPYSSRANVIPFVKDCARPSERSINNKCLNNNGLRSIQEDECLHVSLFWHGQCYTT